MNNIRNFSIIAHIDHGKSTLADRMLEMTGTIEKRKMKEQVLDSMELERERGITIKLAPVRMSYDLNAKRYTLNLIDTPGHIDFSYEVSRALKAVDGAVLLVDATQGVQAQTLSTLDTARNMGLVIIPVVSKIDSSLAKIPEVKKELATLLKCPIESVLAVSGKTGEGVHELLKAIIERVPSPKSEEQAGLQGLVFDFSYSNHRGIIVYVRVFNGAIKKGDTLLFKVTNEKFTVLETGVFIPEEKSVETLSAGETGYIVTGIKKMDKAVVGDTIVEFKNPLPALPGYEDPPPVVWASVYPQSQDDFDLLKNSLFRLKLSDSALSFSEEQSGSLGRGFRCGFLGMLHLEIVVERLKREFNVSLIVTAPSIVYEIERIDGGREKIYSASQLPEEHTFTKIYEPWARLTIITPQNYVGDIVQILHKHEGVMGETHTFGDSRVSFEVEMPLRELMRNFFDELKRVSSGFASFSYKIADVRGADIVKLEMLVAEEMQPAFSTIVPRARAQEDAKKLTDRLYTLLPRQLFPIKIQAKGMGRILSSKTLPALKKDVTGYLYGGDITRKRKLWEKQKKGKKKLQARGTVEIPHDVFLKMVKRE
ncbi:MAG: elongation factor 4 [Parcubacteria group bacterium]|nr:elongation factor 4 [Parcubacteria group bacterium]